MTYFVTPSGPSNPDLPTAEVNGLYNILFGRLADPTGLANAVAYLNKGNSLQSLATILMGSGEYEGAGRRAGLRDLRRPRRVVG